MIEEDSEKVESIDGRVLGVRRWHLVTSEQVEGGRGAAEARAEELASRHVPQHIARHLKPGGRPHRSLFRMQDGTWLVRVKRSYEEAHFRVSVGELIRAEEEIEERKPSTRETGRQSFFGL
ncbi:hypothetical protein ACFPH6_34415 [Streptomyces xiangluensis]|uniref:Uncharacterized protein n=1 Tax=Streptomyces xiangluensis TaxID=2665720 RepID=A0ABV8YZP2_9ACTN